MKIVDTIIFLVMAGLIAQAAIGLSYLVSSIRESEKRASLFAGLQFAGMAAAALLFAYGWKTGFLYSGSGIGILICLIAAAGLGAIFFVKKSPANLKALQGTRGAIVGDVKRVDERDVVLPATARFGQGRINTESITRCGRNMKRWMRLAEIKAGRWGVPVLSINPKTDRILRQLFLPSVSP